MSGAALGLITALALAGSGQEPSAGSGDFRSDARRWAPAPLFRPAPTAPADRVEVVGPNPSCRTPVVHGDNDVDAAFVRPVPRPPAAPAYTMRWAPSTPCPIAQVAARGPSKTPRPRK
jgi:hypothetical protein